MRSGIVNLYQNKVPIYEIMSGASIAFASLLLIIPGFLTDIIGFFILVPFTRKLIFKNIQDQTEIKENQNKNKTIDGRL